MSTYFYHIYTSTQRRVFDKIREIGATGIEKNFSRL